MHGTAHFPKLKSWEFQTAWILAALLDRRRLSYLCHYQSFPGLR